MVKYTVETIKDEYRDETRISVTTPNAKQKTMQIWIDVCENPGGTNSLPYLWWKNGWTDRILEKYLYVDVSVEDSEGNCRHGYNPQHKRSDDGKRTVINFDWMLEATEENKQKIIDECINRFASAKGKSATELKIEKNNKVCRRK